DTVVRTGQQRIQKDGTVVRVVKLNGGASAGEAAMDKKPADTASTAPVSSVATSVKAAPAGPNPCGIIVSQLPASGSVMPTSSTDPAVHKPALPPVRNPG
ncbi:MAG: efflux transporter periplasmic adaptor subunit, partial [Polaromonas sp.]